MIVSNNINQSNSRWLQACVLLCALVVLPLGLGCERDNAVNDPAEPTEEATMKTAAEQAAETRTKRVKDDGIDWRAVMAMAPEDWSDELKAQIVTAGYDLDEVAEKQATLAEGKVTEEFDWDTLRMKIEAAVEAGDMTREEADAKYRAIREKMSREDRADGAEREEASDLEGIGRRIRAAVERGEMTPEEGRERMAAARQAGREGDGDRLREFQRTVVGTAMATAPEDWSDELKTQIVRAGWDLDEFTEGIRQRQQAASTRTDRDMDLDAVKQHLEAAVESGRITREQADARLEAFMKRIGR